MSRFGKILLLIVSFMAMTSNAFASGAAIQKQKQMGQIRAQREAMMRQQYQEYMRQKAAAEAQQQAIAVQRQAMAVAQQQAAGIAQQKAASVAQQQAQQIASQQMAVAQHQAQHMAAQATAQAVGAVQYGVGQAVGQAAAMQQQAIQSAGQAIGDELGQQLILEATITPPEVQEITTLDEIIQALDNSGEAWALMIDPEAKVAVVNRYITRYREQGIRIKKSSAYYAQMIDTMSAQAPEMLGRPFSTLVETVAILEYDFENGYSKDTMARQILGSDKAFFANKKRLGLQ